MASAALRYRRSLSGLAAMKRRSASLRAVARSKLTRVSGMAALPSRRENIEPARSFAQWPAAPGPLLNLHLAEIGLLDHLVVAQALGGAVQYHLAGLQDIPVVGDGERHVGVLLHHEDGGALLVDGLDQVEDLLNVERRQAHGGLVHAEEARPRHQRARHSDHLLLAPPGG